jgi:hypothetical protein
LAERGGKNCGNYKKIFANDDDDNKMSQEVKWHVKKRPWE